MCDGNELSHVHARVRLDRQAEFKASIDRHEEGKNEQFLAIGKSRHLAARAHGDERMAQQLPGPGKV
jgi:hypothetical protein